MQFRQLSIKFSKLKQLSEKNFESEQRELDAVCHTLSIMYVPFADLRDGYICTFDKQI